MHRINDLEEAVSSIKETFNNNRNATALSIQVVSDKVEKTDVKMDTTNVLLGKIGTRLQLLHYSLTALILIGLILGGIIATALVSRMTENKNDLEKLEERQDIEQDAEDLRGAEDRIEQNAEDLRGIESQNEQDAEDLRNTP